MRVSSTQSEITITWSPTSDDGGSVILSYEVYHKLQSQNEASWAKVYDATINTLIFTHTGLSIDPNDDVQYRVRAKTEAGYSMFSIRNTFTLAATPTISSAPVKLSSDDKSISLSWTLTSDGGSPIYGYKLYQTSVTRGGVKLVYDGSNIPTVSSTKVTDLIAGD